MNKSVKEQIAKAKSVIEEAIDTNSIGFFSLDANTCWTEWREWQEWREWGEWSEVLMLL